MCINPIHINTIGLIFDIVGAWFVAIEVVRKFRGEKYEIDPTLYGADKPPWDSKEYKKWESSKFKFMWFGLICLTIGFGLQISSNYLRTENSIIVHPVNKDRSAMATPPTKSGVHPLASPIMKTTEPPIKNDINTK